MQACRQLTCSVQGTTAGFQVYTVSSASSKLRIHQACAIRHISPLHYYPHDYHSTTIATRTTVEAVINLVKTAREPPNMSKSEVIERVNPDKPFPVISYNLPFPETCSKHFTGTLQCSKAFIIVSGSLSRTTDALQRLETALGPEQVVGVWKGMQPHTMYSEVLVISAAIKKAGADCIITVGGGSLIDGAKGMAFVSFAQFFLLPC